MNPLTQATRYLAHNLRYLRKQKGLSQEQLAALAEMPRTTLTHMESGQGNPSLHSLLSIAQALGVGVETLLSRPRPEAQLIPAADVPVRWQKQQQVQVFELLPGAHRGLAIERMVFAPGATLPGRPHLPGTQESLTVLTGQVMLYLVGESFTLNEGDVLLFPGNQRHSYRNPTAQSAVALSVVLPLAR
jgi:XRE family transcriptional regulator, regulator of sulfur utilization